MLNKVINTTWYSAKEVFDQLGIRWHGKDSMKGHTHSSTYRLEFVTTKVGTRTSKVEQYVINEKGIKNICAAYEKDANVFGFNTGIDLNICADGAIKTLKVASTKQIDKLQATVEDLKVVVAKLLTKDNYSKINLIQTGETAKVENVELLQKAARKQIREIVQDYASKCANELEIQGDSRRIFFDLSFKALYTAYKENTPNNIDLKALADKETDAGNKVSGLQIAEKLGLAIDLLNFTKSFYNIN